jgi:hypothetical protein
MDGLTWLSSFPRSGCEWVRVLVASYLLDVPAGRIEPDAADRVAPDLADRFNRGRMVSLGDDRPSLVKTHFHPGVEALRPYREAAVRAVHVVRDPRDVISSHVRLQPLGDDERRWLAMEMIQHLAPAGRPLPGSGTRARHVLGWSSRERLRRDFPHVDDVCVVRFEDLRGDTAATLRTVLEYLGVGDDVDAGRLRRAVEGAALPDTGAAGLSLADIGEEVEAAYRRRLADDQELADCVRKFGYERDGAAV